MTTYIRALKLYAGKWNIAYICADELATICRYAYTIESQQLSLACRVWKDIRSNEPQVHNRISKVKCISGLRRCLPSTLLTSWTGNHWFCEFIYVVRIDNGAPVNIQHDDHLVNAILPSASDELLQWVKSFAV